MRPTDFLRDSFDRVLCINLDRLPHRWAAFQERLRAVEWPFRKVERVSGVDGARLPCPRWSRIGEGGWGCFRTHQRIVEDAIADGVSSLLILEVDALFPPDLTARSEEFLSSIPGDWDALLLGGHHLLQPHEVLPGVVRVLNGNRTHAHAMRAPYIRAAYRHLSDFPQHLRTPTHHVDHRLGVLHLSGEFRVFAPWPWIVGQAAGVSDITSKQEAERFWAGREPLRHDCAAVDEENTALVAICGLYCSGAQLLVQLLRKSRPGVGGVFEDRSLPEYLRRLFAEPTLYPLAPARRQVELLALRGEAFRREAASAGAALAVAEHPLLCLAADSLVQSWRGPIHFVIVEGDATECITALRGKAWCWRRRKDVRDAQLLLLDAMDKLKHEFNVFVLPAETLHNGILNPEELLRSIQGVAV